MYFTLGLIIGSDLSLVLAYSNDQEQAWDHLLIKEGLSKFGWGCISILDSD